MWHKAFQHQDDILGVFGNPKVTGKSNTSDILTAKRTMLYFKTLEKTKGNNLAFFKKHYGHNKLSTIELDQIRDIIKSSGALTETQKYINHQAEMAIKIVPTITSQPKYKHLLSQLATYVATRNK
jgi:geranylgeranyl diphosphate synthase, type I